MPQSDARTTAYDQSPLPDARADEGVGEGTGRAPRRVRGRAEVRRAPSQRAGEGLHVRGPRQGREGTAIGVVPPAAEPERDVLRGAHVEGGGDVRDREGS